MNENDVRNLLSDVVPDLSDEMDRVAQVRRRADRLHRRRRTVAVGAAAVVVLAVAGFLPTWLRGEPVEPFIAAAGPSPNCPQYADLVPKLGQGAEGPVVPEGAIRATLCTYRLDTGTTGAWHSQAATIDRDVSGVVTILNALPDYATFVAEHPEAVDAGCTMSLRPQYRLLFEYPDGTERTVLFAMNCGTVESGDIVRYGENTKVLDEFAERYRSQDGDIPAPPWKW
ncbi:hypothetical protein [Saccharothrix luteola]|uniref:hypothetical protein n=1 Tax=Saccharothrix luteola TaxID=2893018 RepID=UPI001E4D70AD|nr:hypothetical protein [Saccharothrix luteola]MCC8251220.1 hypothetical protein [Saccharothrix luteola]